MNMHNMAPAQHFWWRLLVTMTGILMAFGLALAMLPTLAQQGFSLMIYGSVERLDHFGPEAVAYIRLVHAVLGCVMFGWGVVFMFLALGPLRHGSRDAWRMFVVSLACWFIPDTGYSLLSGFWQNAILNVTFAIAFAMPLWKLRPLAPG